jgi:hypothetical protein
MKYGFRIFNIFWGFLMRKQEVDRICLVLMELQQRRKFYQATILRITNAAWAYVQTKLGWRLDLEEKERNEIKKRASKLLSQVLSGKDVDEEVLQLKQELSAFRLALEPLNAELDAIVAEMERMAGELPVASWVKAVPGFGVRGLAVIVGECDNLSNYHRDGLRKRLGLYPYKEKAFSTWRKDGGLTAEEWVDAGYSPRRRAQIFPFSESLFRAQSERKEKVDAETGEIKPGRPALEPYGALYYKRREKTAITHPEWSAGHSHNDALRKMTVKLVDNLYQAWKNCGCG